jgi:DNA-binding protein HU-beta
MTKNELVRELSEDFEMNKKQVVEMVDAILDKITAVLKAGDKVQLTPFGQFKVRDRAARVARNPQTGEPVNVPAKRVLKFIAGRTLKEAVGTAKRGGAKKSTAKKSTSKAAPARKTATAAKKKAPAAKKTTATRSAASSRKAAPARKTTAKKKGR